MRLPRIPFCVAHDFIAYCGPPGDVVHFRYIKFEEDAVLVTTEEGDSFVISRADDFNTEVQLLRKNHALLAMLDIFKKEEQVTPLNE